MTEPNTSFRRAPMRFEVAETPFTHIQATARMPGFAAWVEGVDLQRPIPAEVAAELRQALWTFGVIFFNPQQITPQQHIALARVFGELSTGSFFDRHDDEPLMETIVYDEVRPPMIDRWHTDLTWTQTPPAGSAIQITEMPPVGGNTCWVSTSKAFAALSPGMKDYLRDLSATHTWEVSGFRNYLASQGDERLLEAFRNYKPISHPVVIRHPETGAECLYVNSTFTKAVDGVDYRESAGVLDFLYAWLQRPEFMVHHRWEPHGIAIWDNRSTQHYAVADYWPNRRVNQRLTFEGPLTS